jgi:hypothetical protein
MYLAEHQSLVAAADAAGFRDIEVIPLEMVRGGRHRPAPTSLMPWWVHADVTRSATIGPSANSLSGHP